MTTGEVGSPRGDGPDEMPLDGLQASLLEMQQLLVETSTFVEFLQVKPAIPGGFPEDRRDVVPFGVGYAHVATLGGIHHAARLKRRVGTM